MTLTLDLTPTEEAQINAVARSAGLTPAEAARKLLTQNLPPAPAAVLENTADRPATARGGRLGSRRRAARVGTIRATHQQPPRPARHEAALNAACYYLGYVPLEQHC